MLDGLADKIAGFGGKGNAFFVGERRDGVVKLGLQHDL